MLRTIIVAALVCVAAVAAQAQTVGYADAISILGRSCGGDIQKYCSKARLADDGITRCLAENRSSISAQCDADMIAVAQSLDAREAAQNNADKICDRDIQRLCNMVTRGRGFVLQCLLKAEPSVSQACNQAITDAGWR